MSDIWTAENDMKMWLIDRRTYVHNLSNWEIYLHILRVFYELIKWPAPS